MAGPYCESCGCAENESDADTGLVRRYRSFDEDGEVIETLCEFCASADIAAGIPHELIEEEGNAPTTTH